MTNPTEYLDVATAFAEQADSIVSEVSSFTLNNDAQARDALRKLAQAKTALTSLRSQVILKEKEIAFDYKDLMITAPVKASSGFWSIFMSKGQKGTARADVKRSISREKSLIDQAYSAVKLSIDSYITSVKGAEAAVRECIRTGTYDGEFSN